MTVMALPEIAEEGWTMSPRTARYLLLALMPVMLVQSLLAQERRGVECYQIKLSPNLKWASSGAWASDGKSLLIVDQIWEQVVKVLPNGKLQTALTKSAPSSPDRETECQLLRPGKIRPFKSGFLLEDEKGSRELRDEIFHIDNDLECTGEPIPIKGREVGDGTELSAVYDWSPLGNGILAFGDLAFGDLKEPGQAEWQSAFLYFEGTARAGRSQIFYRMSVEAKSTIDYTKDYLPYIATIGDRGYILLLNEFPKIVEVRYGVEGLRELPSFPEDFRARPNLSKNLAWKKVENSFGWKQATVYYKIIEGATLAAGLYSSGGDLFLLAKQSIGNDGRTPWWLIKLDPETGIENSRIRLPTDAAHLTVVPGTEFWALIEKGRVQGIGKENAPYMEISSMTLVPTPWLNDPHGALRDSKSWAHCLTVN